MAEAANYLHETGKLPIAECFSREYDWNFGSKQQSQLFISQFFWSISALCCFIVHCFWYNLEVYFFYSSWNLIGISLLLDAAVKLRSTSDLVVHPLMELLQQFDECLRNWLISKGFHRHYFLPWKYTRQPPSHVQHGFSSTHNSPVISPLPLGKDSADALEWGTKL